MKTSSSQSIAYVLNDWPDIARSASGSPPMAFRYESPSISPSMASLSLSSPVLSPASSLFPSSLHTPAATYEPNSAMTFAADVEAEAQKRRMLSVSGMASSPGHVASLPVSAPGSPTFYPSSAIGMARARASSTSSTGSSIANITSPMSFASETSDTADVLCGIRSASNSGTCTPIYNTVDVKHIAAAAVAAATNMVVTSTASKPRKKAPVQKKTVRVSKEKLSGDSLLHTKTQSDAGIRRNRRGRPSLQTPLECPHCKRGGFMQVSKLNKHMKTHSRPHACHGCDMTFATPRDMQRHARRHEETIEVWKCSCSVTFTRDYNMRRHQRHNNSCSALGCYRTNNHGGRRAPITKKTAST